MDSHFPVSNTLYQLFSVTLTTRGLDRILTCNIS